jgi:hypothetical protein
MEIATDAAGSVHGFVDTAGSFTTIDYGGDPRSET